MSPCDPDRLPEEAPFMRFEVPLGLVPHYLQTIMCKVDWVNQNCLLVVPAVGLYYRGKLPWCTEYFPNSHVPVPQNSRTRILISSFIFLFEN